MIATTDPSHSSVRMWMRLELAEGEHIDRRTGEANLTQLAEAAAEHFDHDAWLDDPDHFVWDAAVEAAEAEGALR